MATYTRTQLHINEKDYTCHNCDPECFDPDVDWCPECRPELQRCDACGLGYVAATAFDNRCPRCEAGPESQR